MFGTVLNITGILIGSLAGLAMRRPFSPANQQFFKAALGAYTVWIGLKIAVTSLSGNFWQVGKQLLLLVLALTLGRLLGRLLHVQKGLNRLGRIARQKLTDARPDSPHRAGDGFTAATILFCAAPLVVPGCVQDGLTQNFQPLLLKALLDGLVAMAFVLTFGWPVLLAALPLAAFQVTLTCGAQLLEPMLRTYSLIDSVNGVCGLLIFCVALIIFEIRRIEIGDYLPALAVAPLLTWLWR